MIEVECTMRVTPLNHPETIAPPPWSAEKLSSTESVTGAKNVGDRSREDV